LKDYRGKVMRGLCVMCSVLEDVKHFTLGCGETSGWRMNLKCKKLLNYHEEFIIKKIINCNKKLFPCSGWEKE
jgi:hypothetical protein